MILGYHAILRMKHDLFPILPPYKINPASADVRVGYELILEDDFFVRLHGMYSERDPYRLSPGQRVLVDMLEHVTLPVDLAATFALKSTRAREGYQHALAGWVDPGWDGILTMELINTNQVKYLPLWCGMPMGQLIFTEVREARGYQGRYQRSHTVSGARHEI